MDKPNRAERRKNRFGGGRATENGGWPTVQSNPVFVDPDAAVEPESPAKAPAKAKAEPEVKPGKGSETGSSDEPQAPTG
ncbi:MAG: hypothetical protein ABIZ72_12105 [Candidatus Limnocylindrales bacterium]